MCVFLKNKKRKENEKKNIEKYAYALDRLYPRPTLFMNDANHNKLFGTVAIRVVVEHFCVTKVAALMTTT